jgi:hypothetical protein
MPKQNPRFRLVFIRLAQEEWQLAKKLARREQRTKKSTVNLWAREVVRQYLHEFKVMPQAWGAASSRRKR